MELKVGDIAKMLGIKTPERFIVQEDYYGMYIGGERELVSDKSKAKIYTLLYTAKGDVADMNLNSWNAIPYDD